MMLSKVQPCFQLLRIGSSSSSSPTVSDAGRDLYTFRPTLALSVFRLGRKAELCDVTLQSTSISRIHAELHAEREQGEEEEAGWKVHIKDRSSYGTWVNEHRLQPGVLWELSDGDTLTFGGQSETGSPEFYFLFQKVLVRPSEFDAITIPKADTFSPNLHDRIRTSLDTKPEPGLDISSLSPNRATVILNSIGSLSKMNGSCWTFKKANDNLASPSLVSPSTPPPIPSAIATCKSVPPASKSRRKSAHTVLLEDDNSDDMRSNAVAREGRRKNVTKRRRLCKSECDVFYPSGPIVEFKNENGFYPSLQSKSRLNQLFSITSQSEDFGLGIKEELDECKQGSSMRGRRRAYSSPAYSLPDGRQNFTIISPSLRVCEPTDRGLRGGCAGVTISTGKRRGRPRKHPLSFPSPYQHSGSTVSARTEEPCASTSCRLPQQDTVQWIQCDDCDAWYHVDCIERDVQALVLDTSADFHCGCR